MNTDSVVALSRQGLAEAELRAALIEPCRRGLLTCTQGQPEEADAAYALTWFPLDDAVPYPAEVRLRHAVNMRALRRAS